MELLGWCWVAVKVLVPLWLASHIIRWFLPSEVADRLEIVDNFILARIASIPVFLSNAWLVSAQICYYVGNFFAVVLIAFGAVIVGYSIYLQRETLQFSFAGAYQLAGQLAGDKVAWSGATMLIAATVAICNMWKLNLDRKQYFEKQEKELLERIKKEEEVRREQMKTYHVPMEPTKPFE
ncbi:hypothetical protein FAZ69_04575 [Trinickia terrae]|uniref:Uncharacterized protein n=1 Tax=Trinickia terrae TaxID=2571161 RepID=A0A4U1IDK5_9BURK|nr:hypothetical protein [Trinickia terrae]TKC91721.1 hypothetical protein FAZ69_04575 [Trinickia terrae]